MQRKFIRADELASTPARDDRPARVGRWPVSRATLWRWVRDERIPAPVNLGPGVTAWPIEVIERVERQWTEGGAR